MNVRRLLVVATILVASLVPAASATVPPRNCGKLKVGSKSYVIKADQLRCSTAKADAKAYLQSRKKPRGFTCRNFTDSKMTFRCSKGVQVFFAIRH